MIKLSGYKIIKKIGSGGMGDVYLAEHENLKKKVAIKSLHKNLVNNTDFRKRFKKEAQTHSKLDHSNIVKLYDYQERKDGLFLIMEYVDGKQLDQHIKKISGPIPEQDLIPLFTQVLDAIGYAHKQGLIHRDIKPSNIMLDKEGGIKVLDFGIAKLQEEDQGLTKTGVQIGTVFYMSPEQVNAEKVNKLTDIYSLGVTLFYMAVGKPPYENSHAFKIGVKIISESFPLASEFYPGVSEKIEHIIEKATQKQKADRYQSCEEFLKDVNASSVKKRYFKHLVKSSTSGTSQKTKKIFSTILNKVKRMILMFLKKLKKVFIKISYKGRDFLNKNIYRLKSILKENKKKLIIIFSSFIILSLFYLIIIKYPSLIYNYDELDIKIDNQETVFDLSSNDFGKVYFEINKPYNNAELVISIEGGTTITLYDNYGEGFGAIDFFKDLSKRTKDKIVSKLVSGDKIDMSIEFNVMGGISNDEILASHSQSYFLFSNPDVSSNLPQIIEVNGTNFTKQYSEINKEDLISKILDDDFVKTSNLKETKIIRNNSTVKISVKVDKIYEHSYIVYYYGREKNLDDILKHSSADTEQLEQKTTVKKNTDGSYTLSRELSSADTDGYTHLVLHNYDSEGIDHMVLLGSFIVDNKAPIVGLWSSSCNIDDDISGCVFVVHQGGQGGREPFQVLVKGDISKIYINGYKISFDKEKAKKEMLDLYKVLYFTTPVGHYRWPIKVYDLRGNMSETYKEGEARYID